MIGDVGLVSGHVLLSDWLLLLAFVAFVVEAAAIVANRPAISRGILTAVGLALIALAWMVL
jgi:hypothetical protein